MYVRMNAGAIFSPGRTMVLPNEKASWMSRLAEALLRHRWNGTTQSLCLYFPNPMDSKMAHFYWISIPFEIPLSVELKMTEAQHQGITHTPTISSVILVPGIRKQMLQTDRQTDKTNTQADTRRHTASRTLNHLRTIIKFKPATVHSYLTCNIAAYHIFFMFQGAILTHVTELIYRHW